MKYLFGLTNLIQNYIASFLAILCLGFFGGLMAGNIGLNGCTAQFDSFDFYALIWLSIGLFLIGFVIKDIIFPKIKTLENRTEDLKTLKI